MNNVSKQLSGGILMILRAGGLPLRHTFSIVYVYRIKKSNYEKHEAK